MSEASANLAPLLAALGSLSVGELTQLGEAVEAARQAATENGRRALLEELRAKARELGLSPEDLAAALAPTGAPAKRGVAKGEGKKVAAKYRGPNGEEWTGRGIAPKWLAALEASGRARDEFLIKS
jgi:DNA-binding protein H-NS